MYEVCMLFTLLTAEGTVESSEDDPYEAPVSVSSDGSWRPEGERKRQQKEVGSMKNYFVKMEVNLLTEKRVYSRFTF